MKGQEPVELILGYPRAFGKRENALLHMSVAGWEQLMGTGEQLTDILEAGRYAPTGGNCQTVHFVVIMNVEIRENLRGLVQEAFLQMELFDEQYADIQNSIKLSRRGDYAFDYHAPILVVVANRKRYAAHWLWAIMM